MTRLRVHPSHDAIQPAGFIQHPLRFVAAAIDVATVSEARFQIADRVPELSRFAIQPVLATRTIDTAPIQSAIEVSLEILCESIQAMNTVAQIPTVVTAVIPVTPIIRPALRRSHSWNKQR